MTNNNISINESKDKIGVVHQNDETTTIISQNKNSDILVIDQMLESGENTTIKINKEILLQIIFAIDLKLLNNEDNNSIFNQKSD